MGAVAQRDGICIGWAQACPAAGADADMMGDDRHLADVTVHALDQARKAADPLQVGAALMTAVLSALGLSLLLFCGTAAA